MIGKFPIFFYFPKWSYINFFFKNVDVFSSDILRKICFVPESISIIIYSNSGNISRWFQIFEGNFWGIGELRI